MSALQGSDDRSMTDFARQLFPGLAAQLDSGLLLASREVAGGSADKSGPSGTWSGSTGSGVKEVPLDFEAQLDAEVSEFQRRNAGLAWHEVADPFARERLRDAVDRTRAALVGTGVAVPEPEAFVAGFQLATLTEPIPDGYAVVPAPHGLGLAKWLEIFRVVAERLYEPGVEHSLSEPRQPELNGPALNIEEPLVVAREAAQEFELLERVTVGAKSLTTDGSVQWTLRLVPSAPAPSLLGLNFEHGPHCSLPEMLMMQLMRITAGDEPVDQASFTWLEGDLAGGKLAARHVYDAADRAVRVSCREIGNQGPHMGARAPRELVE